MPQPWLKHLRKYLTAWNTNLLRFPFLFAFFCYSLAIIYVSSFQTMQYQWLREHQLVQSKPTYCAWWVFFHLADTCLTLKINAMPLPTEWLKPNIQLLTQQLKRTMALYCTGKMQKHVIHLATCWYFDYYTVNNQNGNVTQF